MKKFINLLQTFPGTSEVTELIFLKTSECLLNAYFYKIFTINSWKLHVKDAKMDPATQSGHLTNLVIWDSTGVLKMYG